MRIGDVYPDAAGHRWEVISTDGLKDYPIVCKNNIGIRAYSLEGEPQYKDFPQLIAAKVKWIVQWKEGHIGMFEHRPNKLDLENATSVRKVVLTPGQFDQW